MAAESNPTAVARRAMLHGAGVGGALALLSGLREAHAADAGSFPAHPKWKLVFVNHVTTNPFFVPTQYGIQDACALLDCDLPVDRLGQRGRGRDGERDERGDRRQGRRHRGADRRSARLRRTDAARARCRHSGVLPTTPTRPPAAPTSGSPISARTSTSPAIRWASASSAWSIPAWSGCSSPRPASSTSSRGWMARSPRSRSPARRSTHRRSPPARR